MVNTKRLGGLRRTVKSGESIVVDHMGEKFEIMFVKKKGIVGIDILFSGPKSFKIDRGIMRGDDNYGNYETKGDEYYD